MQPRDLLETLLHKEGRVCPACGRPDAVTTKNVQGSDDWAIGDLWCPSCGWEMTVAFDGDAIRQWFRYGTS